MIDDSSNRNSYQKTYKTGSSYTNKIFKSNINNSTKNTKY